MSEMEKKIMVKVCGTLGIAAGAIVGMLAGEFVYDKSIMAYMRLLHKDVLEEIGKSVSK